MSALPFGLLLITPERPAAEILAGCRAALAGVPAGPERVALQLRAKHLPASERAQLGRALRACSADAGVPLLVNGELELAVALGADGVQLPEGGPSVAAARAALGPRALVGASRHAEPGVRAAAADGASFVLISPVYAVPGKGRPLGPGGLSALCAACAVPAIALGGVRAEHVPAVVAAGAGGIAVVRVVFDAPDPAAAVVRLLHALGAALAFR